MSDIEYESDDSSNTSENSSSSSDSHSESETPDVEIAESVWRRGINIETIGIPEGDFSSPPDSELSPLQYFYLFL